MLGAKFVCHFAVHLGSSELCPTSANFPLCYVKLNCFIFCATISVSVRISLELFIEVLNLNNFKRITVFGSLYFNSEIHDLKSYALCTNVSTRIIFPFVVNLIM